MASTETETNETEMNGLQEDKNGDMRSYSRKFITDFIDLYKAHPTLWHVKSRDYRDRKKKAAAYELLVAKCREVEPGACKYTVVKKINSLRTCYRKELRKVHRSLGTGEDGVYKPKLWYFDLLSFLDEDTLATNMESPYFIVDEDMKLYQFPSKANQNELHSQDDPLSDMDSRLDSRASTPVQEEKREKVIRIQKVRDEDEFDLFGKIIACKMRKLATDQKIYAEKLINDTLFEAEMGNLDSDCTLGEAMLPSCAAGASFSQIKEEESLSD